MGLRLKRNCKRKEVLPLAVCKVQGSYAETIPLQEEIRIQCTHKQEFMAVDHEWTGMSYCCLALHATFLERMDFRHVTIVGIFYCLDSRISNLCVFILSHLHTAMCYICHMDAKSLVLKPAPGTKCLNMFIGSLFISLNRGYNVILD